jgi:hypothetical protein
MHTDYIYSPQILILTLILTLTLLTLTLLPNLQGYK